MKLTFSISARAVALVLIFVALFFVVLSFAGQLYNVFSASAGLRLFGAIPLDPNLFGYVPLVDVGQDRSIPSWYSSLLLLFCSILLAVISVARKRQGARYVNHWRVLAVIFLYLAVDEGVAIHEIMGRVVRTAVDAYGFERSGVLGSLMPVAWVIPGIALVIVFALAYLRFFFALPPRQRLLFLLSGAIYVGAAAGMEVLHGSLFSPPPEQGLTDMQRVARTITPTIEEFLEMTGIIIFIYALLSYVRSNVDEIALYLPKNSTDHKEPG